MNRYGSDICTSCKFYPCELIEERKCLAENCSNESDYEITDKNYAAKITLLGEKQSDERSENNHCIEVESISINGRIQKEKKLTVCKENSCSKKNILYDGEEIKNGCIMGERYVIQVECGKKTVADGIGDHYKIKIRTDYKIEKDTVNQWEPSQPVFISAQTGQGKNYFVEKKLIPYVEEINYSNSTKMKILIISNRLALKCQINSRIGGNQEEEGEEKIYSYKDVADVMTYQGLLGKKKYLEGVQKNKRSRYIFVICDEAHFFTSDAMYNPYTEKILSTIVSLFRSVIRVYMTATPYECLQPICDYEKGMPVFYHFKRDYSYLDVKTYSEIWEFALVNKNWTL